MLKEKLFKDLFNKIPDTGKLVIFGANITGEKILKDLKIYKPDSEVIGFIDNFVQNSFHNLPIWTMKDFCENPPEFDLVIMSTTREQELILAIFDLYNIPVIRQTYFVRGYYRDLPEVLNEENYNKVINIFDSIEDMELFDKIFNVRIKFLTPKILEEHYNNVVTPKDRYRKHYLDKINKTAVKILLDLGMNNGTNVIAFNRLLSGLQKVYGFEVIYDIARDSLIEPFIMNDKLEIVPLALGDSNKKINFYINKGHLGASYGAEITDKTPPPVSGEWECRVVDTSTIDDFCRQRNVTPDFIKMDIEGAELSALKGGIETIKKYRPQLAISIYHSDDDFINIPMYLYDNLENYEFRLGHYSPYTSETVLYAIPNELA